MNYKQIVTGICLTFCAATTLAGVDIQVERRIGSVPSLFFEPNPSGKIIEHQSRLPNYSWENLDQEHHFIKFSIVDFDAIHLYACENEEQGKFFEAVVSHRPIGNDLSITALATPLHYVDEGIVTSTGKMPHVLTADLTPMAVSMEGLQWIFDRLPEVRKLALPLVPPGCLENIMLPRKIESLVIHNTHLGKRLLEQLAELPDLNSLTLSRCHITREALQEYGFEYNPKSIYRLNRLADGSLSRLPFRQLEKLRMFNCSEWLHRVMRIQPWPALRKLELDRTYFFRVAGVRPTNKPPPPIDLRIKFLEEVIYYGRSSENPKWQDTGHAIESIHNLIQRDCLTNELPIKLVLVEETGQTNEQ